MIAFMTKRLVYAIPLLFVVIALLFLLLKLAPGDPVSSIVGNFPVPDAYRELINEKYHLNDPFIVQLGSYLGSLLRGDFGYSYAFGANVIDLIIGRLAPTLILVLSGLALGSFVGVVVGMISARSTSKAVNGITNTSMLIAFSIPSFWLGQLLILLLAIRLKWFPSSGFVTTGVQPGTWDFFLSSVHHLVLPIVTLAIVEAAAVGRIMRASTVETISQDYMITAAMKGLSPRVIGRRHVMRNAGLPVVTVVGYRFGQALAGVLLIETVFAYPGMGLLLQQAVLRRDNQTVLGIVVFIAVAVVVVNLIVDLIYGLLDPRISHK